MTTTRMLAFEQISRDVTCSYQDYRHLSETGDKIKIAQYTQRYNKTISSGLHNIYTGV